MREGGVFTTDLSKGSLSNDLDRPEVLKTELYPPESQVAGGMHAGRDDIRSGCHRPDMSHVASS